MRLVRSRCQAGLQLPFRWNVCEFRRIIGNVAVRRNRHPSGLSRFRGAPSEVVCMQCPLCGRRAARRACPAIGETICPVCCGTKRLVELPCPDDCVYLHTARQHPPAVEQRQHQRDLALVLPAIRTLTTGQQQLFVLLLGMIHGQSGDPLRPLTDEDVIEAATSLAATYETAARGVIYEHQPQSLPAQRLQAALKEALADIGREVGGRMLDADAPHALRAVAQAAQGVVHSAAGSRTAFLELTGRLGGPKPSPGAEEAPRPGGLILPPG
jgi:hypothetical protein